MAADSTHTQEIPQKANNQVTLKRCHCIRTWLHALLKSAINLASKGTIPKFSSIKAFCWQPKMNCQEFSPGVREPWGPLKCNYSRYTGFYLPGFQVYCSTEFSIRLPGAVFSQRSLYWVYFFWGYIYKGYQVYSHPNQNFCSSQWTKYGSPLHDVK